MDRTDELIGDLYEAALRSDDFLDAVQHVARAVGADFFHLYSVDPLKDRVHFSHYTPGTFGQPISAYLDYYRRLDPRVELTKRVAANAWFACHDHFDERYVGRSEFFQDFLIANGMRYMFGTRIESGGRDPVLAALVRVAGGTPFNPAEREQLARLGGHLQRAIGMWQDARAIRSDASTGAEIAAQMNLAVFTVDRLLRTTSVNAQGDALLRASASLRHHEGQLVAGCPTQRDGFHAALSRVLRTRRPETFALAPQPEAPHELFLSITGLPHSAVSSLGGPGLMIVARRRTGRSLVTAAQLRNAFGLSAAEAAVAEALLIGMSPDEYAAQNHVAITTVRTQLRAVFAKTRTRTQAEAVGVMLWILEQSG